MQLAPVALRTPPITPSPDFEKAVSFLDWAHETAGSAAGSPEDTDFTMLVSASQDAANAAELLGKLELPTAAEHARTAANAFDSAAQARRNEDPDVANAVIQARGEDAETAIHAAFTAMGLDGRGE